MKWLRERSTQEKLMLALAVLLLVGIIVRWAWVKDEVTEAVRERFTAPAPASTEQTEE